MIEASKPVRNWDKAFTSKEIMIIAAALLALLLLVAIVLFALSHAAPAPGSNGDPYAIVEKHVFDAFSGREAR